MPSDPGQPAPNASPVSVLALAYDDSIRLFAAIAKRHPRLSGRGLAVTRVGGAEEAVAAAGTGPLDVVYLNVSSVGIPDCLALVAWLRRHTKALVIVTNSYGYEGLPEAVLGAGADACLRMPFKTEEISKALEGLGARG